MGKRPRGEWAEGLPYTNKAFRPYVIALGQFNLAWNDLHVSLSLLFCTLMGGGFVNKFLAIWTVLNTSPRRPLSDSLVVDGRGMNRWPVCRDCLTSMNG